MVAVCSDKITDYDPGYVQIGPIHQICGTQLSQFQNVPFCLPPSAGRQAQILILEILNAWMPVPLYLSGVVNPARGGIAFPRSKSGIFDLILNPAVSGKHFETASIVKNITPLSAQSLQPPLACP